MSTSPLILYSSLDDTVTTLVGADVKEVNQSIDKIIFLSTLLLLLGYADTGRAGVKNVNQSTDRIFSFSTVSLLPGHVDIGRGRCQECQPVH